MGETIPELSGLHLPSGQNSQERPRAEHPRACARPRSFHQRARLHENPSEPLHSYTRMRCLLLIEPLYGILGPSVAASV